MAKKEDHQSQLAQQERIDQGRVIGELCSELVANPDLLGALLSDEDDDMGTGLEPEAQRALAAELKAIAARRGDRLAQSLSGFGEIERLFMATLWADEGSTADEEQVAPLLVELDALGQRPFAPWLHDTLNLTLEAIEASGDEEHCIYLACGALNALGTLASLLEGGDAGDDEQLDDLSASAEDFRAWWELVLVLLDQPSPFDEAPDDDFDLDAVGDAEALEDFQQLDVLEQLDRVAAVLQEEGVEVVALDPRQRRELLDEGYLGLGRALELLVPERYGSFATEPFGAYTEDELHEFFPALWRRAAEVGGWQLEGLRLEVEDDQGATSLCVRFEAFGSTHEWYYQHDSSYADGSWIDDIRGFAKEYLVGRYLFDLDAEISLGYAYLPKPAAQRLARLVE